MERQGNCRLTRVACTTRTSRRVAVRTVGDNFVTHTYGRLPLWGWIGIAVGGILVYRTVSKKSSMASTTANSNRALSGNNGPGTPPNIFFLPQGAQAQIPGQTLTVNVNRLPGNGPSQVAPPISFTPPPAIPYNPIGSGPTPTSAPAPTAPPVAAPHTFVTVKKWPGVSSGGLAEWDTTLWGIATHFGTTVQLLQNLNHISNPNLIYPGQEIEVN